ncbi:hypothetical protein RFI_25965, partial [Reticulomyxa filosa]
TTKAMTCDGRYEVAMVMTPTGCYGEWAFSKQLPVYFENDNRENIDPNNWNTHVWMDANKKRSYIFVGCVSVHGGMQNGNNTGKTNGEYRKYDKEVKTLIRLFGDMINKEELQRKIEQHNGNIELVIREIIRKSVTEVIIKKKNMY